MPAKKPQLRLPFNAAHGKTRSGRPRVERVTVICSRCGEEMQRRITDVVRNESKRTFCGACWREHGRTEGSRKRQESSQFGRRLLARTHNGQPVRIDHQGYVWIYEPTFRTRSGCHHRVRMGFHPEHRVVASRMLGRPLRRGEQVHHVNGIKTDNRPENLQVLSREAHRKLHNDEIAEKLARLGEYERRFGPLDGVSPQPVSTAPLRDLKTEGVH